MANILITYDLKESTSQIHKQVKDDMIAKGFSKLCGNEKYQLPNTTLIKFNTTVDECINSLRASVEKFSKVANELERYICVDFSTGKCWSIK